MEDLRPGGLGLLIGDERVTKQTVTSADVVTVGDSTLRITRLVGASEMPGVTDTTDVGHIRSPRVVPRTPEVKVTLPAAPQQEEKARFPLLATAPEGADSDPADPSRTPVTGYLHLKDVLYATGEEREQPITPWRIRRLEAVSADDQVEDALRHMQRTGVHCALVRDAGAVVGILFLEDILELLVGEVRDVLQRP